MIACRVLCCLLALCVALPAWAIPAPAWQECDGRQPSICRLIVPEQMALAGPVTTISAVVKIPPDTVDEPLSVDIDAMASASIRWDGVLIGRNGVVGPEKASETPGLFSFSVPVPTRMVHAGENRVTITFSAHHLWLPVHQPLHRLAIGPPRSAEAYTLRHYLPTLATLAVPLVALLLLSTLLLAGRVSSAALLPMAVLALIVVQGLLEVSKLALAYTYPWHLARLVALAGLTATVGLLLVVLTCRVFSTSRTGILVAATAAAMLIAFGLVAGPDRQALVAFEIALLAEIVVAAPAAMRRDRQAIALIATSVLLAIWVHQAGPDFLDTGYYVTAAVTAAAFGVVAVMRPVRAPESPASATPTEPTVALCDGARQHLVTPSSILFLKADDDYCTVHVADGRELTVTMTLKALLALLPGNFLRIHRSHVINMQHLSGTRPGANGRNAELSDGTILPIGRAYAADLRTLINGDG